MSRVGFFNDEEYVSSTDSEAAREWVQKLSPCTGPPSFLPKLLPEKEFRPAVRMDGVAPPKTRPRKVVRASEANRRRGSIQAQFILSFFLDWRIYVLFPCPFVNGGRVVTRKESKVILYAAEYTRLLTLT
jgi:hypothetical protein